MLIPRVIQPNEERVGDGYVFAGPCIDAVAPTGWTPPPGDGRPLVYVSFGTVVHRPAGPLRADRAPSWARPTGWCSRPARSIRQFSALDAARVQPQLDVLAHADVFITHAGMGATVESLWFGVPTVAIPQAVDQFTNAAQLEAIGAGVQLGERSLSEAVAAALACAPRARELRDARAGRTAGPTPPTPVERLVAQGGPEVALRVFQEAAGEADASRSSYAHSMKPSSPSS